MNEKNQSMPDLFFFKNGFDVELTKKPDKQQNELSFGSLNAGIKFGLQSKDTLKINKLDVFDDDDNSPKSSSVEEKKPKLPNLNDIIKENDKKVESREKTPVNLKKKEIEKNDRRNSDKKSDKHKKRHRSIDDKNVSRKNKRRSNSRGRSGDRRKSDDSRGHSGERRRKERKSDGFYRDKSRRYLDNKLKYDNGDGGKEYRRRDSSPRSSNYDKKRERYSDPRYLKYHDSHGDKKRLSDSARQERRDYSAERKFVRPRTPGQSSLRRSLSSNERNSNKIVPLTKEPVEEKVDPNKRFRNNGSIYRGKIRHGIVPQNRRYQPYGDNHKTWNKNRMKGHRFQRVVERTITEFVKEEHIPVPNVVDDDNVGECENIETMEVMDDEMEYSRSVLVAEDQGGIDYVKTESPDMGKEDFVRMTGRIVSKIKEHKMIRKAPETNSQDQSQDNGDEEVDNSHILLHEKISENRHVGKVLDLYDDIEEDMWDRGSGNADSEGEMSNGESEKESGEENLSNIMYRNEVREEEILNRMSRNEDRKEEMSDVESGNEDGKENMSNGRSKNEDRKEEMSDAESGNEEGEENMSDKKSSNEDRKEKISDDESGNEDMEEDVSGNVSDCSSDKTTSMRLSPMNDVSHEVVQQPKERSYPRVSDVFSDDELVDIDIGLLTSIPERYRRGLNKKFSSINSKRFLRKFQQLIYEALKEKLPGVSFDEKSLRFDFNMRILPDRLVLSIDELVANHLEEIQI